MVVWACLQVFGLYMKAILGMAVVHLKIVLTAVGNRVLLPNIVRRAVLRVVN